MEETRPGAVPQNEIRRPRAQRMKAPLAATVHNVLYSQPDRDERACMAPGPPDRVWDLSRIGVPKSQ